MQIALLVAHPKDLNYASRCMELVTLMNEVAKEDPALADFLRMFDLLEE